MSIGTEDRPASTEPAEPRQIWDGKIFTGEWEDAGGGIIDVFAPASGTKLAAVGAATVDDLERSVRSAARAQQAWAELTYDKRAAVLRNAARILEAEPERLLNWLVPESGSGQGKAHFETNLVISELNECAALASQPQGQLLQSSKPRLSLARRVPFGVVGVIAPFNFPAILAMRSVAPALAVGNAVILKPDPRTAISGGFVLAQLLADAGLPAGVFQVLPGAAEVGEALVAHPRVPCISFTGSTAAGRKIGAAAGSLLKTVHLELGGNNALLVLPNVDVEAAAAAGAWGSFLHQGQICMTTGRHLVHESIADEYIAALVRKAQQITVGDPTDPQNALGPLIDAGQRDRVHALVTAAQEQGATVAAGGAFEDLYYQPTVLTGVAADNPSFTQEIFGPVAPVLVYRDLEEAIEIINASEYGLSVGILTSDAYKGFELSRRIHAGIVHVNDQTVDDEATIPFGGHKASGVGGRFGGTQANLESFTEQQWITVQADVERYPF